MKKMIYFLLIAALVFLPGCRNGVVQKENTGLKAMEVIGSEAARYEGIFDKYQERTSFSYHCLYYLADLNGDGEYEMLRSYWYGSGIVSGCIECCEPISKTFSRIDERGARDYMFYVYEDELYVIGTQNMISSQFEFSQAYRPILQDDKLTLKELEKYAEQDVLDSWDDDEFFIPFE